MTTEFDINDFNRLKKAHTEIQELKKFIVKRAEIYAKLNNITTMPRFESGNGFAVRINEYTIFSEVNGAIKVFLIDEQGGGHTCGSIDVPHAFVFGTKTQEEKDLEAYLSLKARFEPAGK